MPLVLIVDDNDKNRTLARDVLGAAGFRTMDAANATEGIGLAVAHLPDVILMDLRLPDMNGADAREALGQDERTARIPVVAMSATSLERSGDWLAAAGFVGRIEKPIVVGLFAEQVRRYCGARS
jgi:CheY-like chemotaxis protein